MTTHDRLPADWLVGYFTVYPPERPPAPRGTHETRWAGTYPTAVALAQAVALAAAIATRTEDGREA